MNHYKGVLIELLLERYQNASIRISLPKDTSLGPGQYLQIHAAEWQEDAGPYSFFFAGAESVVHQKGSAIIDLAGSPPAEWTPGTELSISGPLGRGFQLPQTLRRLALLSFLDHPGRLLPLVRPALKSGAEVILLFDGEVEGLPLAADSQPLSNIRQTLDWADYLVIEVNGAQTEKLLELLAPHEIRKKHEGQVLVLKEMPCGGLARCAVCAFTSRNSRFLACEDGPIVELKKLLS